MKRWFFAAAACLLLHGTAAAYSAQAYAVLAAETGVLLDSENAQTQLPMASTTKIMTGLLAAEDAQPERVISVPASCAGVEGSSMYLKAGELLPLRDVLYGLMLCSGNDAAECIAAVCGGREAFVAKMNARAQQLGLVQTHFENPSGLDGAQHHTTAEELAKLTAEALKNPLFAQVVRTKNYTAGGRTMVNHNKLLKLYDRAIGVKTGFTKTAGRCLVSAAQQDGRTVIAVTLNDGNDWEDHMHMLDAAWESMTEQTWAQQGEAAKAISVQTGTKQTVNAVYAEQLKASVFDGEQTELQIDCMPFVYAPVSEGTVCGQAKVMCGDTVLSQTDLILGASVDCDTSQEDTSRLERFRQWLDKIRHREVEE